MRRWNKLSLIDATLYRHVTSFLLIIHLFSYLHHIAVAATDIIIIITTIRLKPPIAAVSQQTSPPSATVTSDPFLSSPPLASSSCSSLLTLQLLESTFQQVVVKLRLSRVCRRPLRLHHRPKYSAQRQMRQIHPNGNASCKSAH